MRDWIRRIAFSAVGALLAAASGQVLAAGECVTIAHDVASGEKLNLDPARNIVLDGAGLIVSSTTPSWTSTATFSSCLGSPPRGSRTRTRPSGPSSCARG